MGQREMLRDTDDYDAQISIKIRPAEVKDVYNFIAHHKPGWRLANPDSWYFEGRRKCGA